MTKGITLHSKHGVNPTISQCFWCGKDKVEIQTIEHHDSGETLASSTGS